MNIKISDEVKLALAQNKPVVSLESTIISHGMPYPLNVETALKVEEIIRSYGVVPATIGIIDGTCIIGMSASQIEEFGKRSDIIKVSRRDLPVVCAKKLWGATTVSATMILSNMAQIELFVTGGIGGVHRGASETFDISADLEELAKTNVSVVCAGAKAILDLPLTLEYLETKGVVVLGYQTKELPAFYTQKSGLEVDYQIDSAKELAEVINMKRLMKLDGGILITNPIPKEFSLDEHIMHQAINEAMQEAETEKIKGKEITPFLLDKIKTITAGKSLESNIQLVFNNAHLGAKIAQELARVKNG